MIAHIAEAVGAPTPTVVLDAETLPESEERLRPVLTEIRRELIARGQGQVLKFALVRPSEHPLFDLDYRFVQALPGGPDRFDFLGSCGHSILSSVLVAAEINWLPRLAPGSRVRVRVLNNGDHVVCEVDEARHGGGSFTVHFLQGPNAALSRLLVTGAAADSLPTPAGVTEVSIVDVGNPYVFVAATELGLRSREELFDAGEDVFARLAGIRAAAATHLGRPAGSVFPKIAAVGGYQPGRLAARAISVPHWHPTLALTGATCLAAAAAIPGTVPFRLLRRGGDFAIDTPGGTTSVSASVDRSTLQWVSVRGKRAHLHGPIRIDREVAAWQPLSV
ncbi:PrpF domain-containing protein [Actinokineospora enzanensis]|uniref:PrpF domain-containing protein n=1 Tax=Actinokineospora enzanensis TaxID=155975 RepID=UPI000373B478|nr:PrpF domain-containing protein [Actinokineospora enzanensis]